MHIDLPRRSLGSGGSVAIRSYYRNDSHANLPYLAFRPVLVQFGVGLQFVVLSPVALRVRQITVVVVLPATSKIYGA